MLDDLITEAALREWAGPRSFERGEDYFESGAVTDLIDTGKAIKARVMGSEEYVVRFWNEQGDLGYDCTCPFGDEGAFCKHAVAAGLVWLSRDTEPNVDRPRGDKEFAAVRSWLEGAPREALVELLVEQIENDIGLRYRLHVRAVRAQASEGIDIGSLKKTVEKALQVHDFLDYHGMRALLDRAYSVLELIAGLREEGHAVAAWELAQYGMKRALAAYENSGGSAGAFGDLLHQIAAEHLEACRAARPNPRVLGKQLFEFMLRDQWGLAAFDDYAPIMGDAGLKAFRAVAEKEWKKVPSQGPGERNSMMRADVFRITQIMEALARHDDDTDALIAIKSRDLTLPYHFLQIAEILANAKRHEEALTWAERGHTAFSEHDPRLVDFLVETYRSRKRYDDAIRLSWDAFVQRPTLSCYQRLEHVGESVGAWPAWRTKAIEWIRGEYLPSVGKPRTRWQWAPAGHSLLVEIFLWEGDSDAALKEAREGRCTEDLWFQIAGTRETEHPADAAEIYRARIDAIISRGKNPAYDEATRLLEKIHNLMQRAGQSASFAEYLTGVRARHKAKRNFMQRTERIAATVNDRRTEKP